MAWISGLAGKAENILNKIDQNAATALVTTTTISPGLDNMRRSLSSSTQSLKATLSPSVRGSGHQYSASTSGSVHSDSWLTAIRPESMSLSRRSSSSLKVDESSESAVTIVDIDAMQGMTDIVNNGKHHTTLLGQMNKHSDGDYATELAAFKIALSEVTSERDELRIRLTELSRDIENAGLKQRIQEYEILSQRLTDERNQAQQQLYETQTTSQSYVHSLTELESNLAQLQQEYLEIMQKWKMQSQEIELQRQELNDYRKKAQRALQMKDQLITKLKARDNGSNPDGSSEDQQHNVIQLEFDAIKLEHKNTHEENRKLLLQIEELRSEWSAAQQQFAEQQTTQRNIETGLRKELRVERERIMSSESEQRMLGQELQTLRQQLSNQMAASATRLQEKDQQLDRIRKSSAASGDLSSWVGTDIEMRIKALTQSLVDKQSAVENITAERNALRLQLEKTQDQLQQSQYSHRNSNTSRNPLLLNSTDDAKAQCPPMLRANPFDNRVARRVKRAYSTLDSAGIRLGTFLRRYPLMRVFVLMYVTLLHLWVMFILISYTPN